MGYKLSQAILERTEHSAGKPTTGAQPVFPDCPHVRRQHQFIPKFDELVDVDEIADVVGRAFRQNLFVDADPILTIDKVVVGASAPADMRRQRYVIRRLRNRRILDIIGYRYRSCGRSHSFASRCRHNMDSKTSRQQRTALAPMTGPT